MFWRKFLACLLAVFLVTPAWSSPAGIGVAATSQLARVNGTQLAPGTTLFSGDVVESGRNGTARLTFPGGGLALIGARSRVQVTGAQDDVALELLNGRASFRLVSGKVEARLRDATIRAASENASGIVAWRSETSVVIAAEKGSLEVTAAATGKTVVLREGEGIEATLVPDPAPQGQQGQGPRALSGRTVVVLGAVLIGTVSLLAWLFNASENKPGPDRLGDVVSPFRP